MAVLYLEVLWSDDGHRNLISGAFRFWRMDCWDMPHSTSNPQYGGVWTMHCHAI